MRQFWRPIVLGMLLFAAGVTLNNSSLVATQPTSGPVLLAHRGIAQRYDMTDVRNDTCTAARMMPPKHDYLENTIPSLDASFKAGADIAELDVHPTTDGKFAVFHDWTLDCRTDGGGVTREHSLEELKSLDIGYGYTADGGKTFPFRGKGIGLMPSLDEVLTTFPEKRFLINVKSRDRSEGEKLAVVLAQFSAERRAQIMVYGGDEPIAEVKRRLPEIRTASRGSLKNCLIRYVLQSWSGFVPDACRNSMVLVPINVAPWLWGWPNRFLARMAAANSNVFLLGPYKGGEFSTGIDSVDDLRRIPAGYAGGIWTNEIETVGRTLGRRN